MYLLPTGCLWDFCCWSPKKVREGAPYLEFCASTITFPVYVIGLAWSFIEKSNFHPILMPAQRGRLSMRNSSLRQEKVENPMLQNTTQYINLETGSLWRWKVLIASYDCSPVEERWGAAEVTWNTRYLDLRMTGGCTTSSKMVPPIEETSLSCTDSFCTVGNRKAVEAKG